MAQRIDDHSFWAGKGNDESPFPMGSKMKRESGAQGAGGLVGYAQDAEAIRRVQERGTKDIRRQDMKDGYRN